jgi:STE20-related kinase adapter protein alpha
MSYGSVKDLMTSHMPDGLPELACCLIVRDLCQALQYLHSQGVVHRAVRSSHVLLRDSGAAVLSGLRYSTGLQATGEGRPNLYSYPLHGVTGNLAWLAPEILQQNLLGYNETSDIYSLAVTICEMANGVVPFSEMPATLMLVEKLRGACPTLMDRTTVEEGVEVGQPTDSGVGDSVGSFPTVLVGGGTPAYNSRQYSPQFHHLVTQCSQLHSSDRPSAQDLLGHPFIKQLKKTNTTLLTLIHPIQPLITTQEFSSEDDGLVIELMEDLNLEKVEVDWIF